MVDKKLRAALAAYCEEAGLEESEQPIILDAASYDGSIVGVTENNRIVYSLNSMVSELAADEGWTLEEAIEWIEYNTMRAIPYMGDHAPIILTENKGTLMERYGEWDDDDDDEGHLPEEEAAPILEALGLSESEIVELARKRDAIGELDIALQTAREIQKAPFGSAVGVELRTYVCPDKGKPGSWYAAEYLIVTYKGGARACRNATHNSSAANFREVAGLLDGGYYAENDTVAEMEENGYVLDILDGGVTLGLALRKAGKEAK